MEISYTWKITQMKRKSSTGCVFMIDYDMIGTDGEYTGKTSCTTMLEIPENESDLIPFENLTENLVLQWVKERLGEGSIENLKKEVLDDIEKQRNPIELTGLPW